MKSVSWIFVLLCLITVLEGATTISAGNVFGTWTSAGSPYNIMGNITIPNGQILNIQAGVSVIFQGYYNLNVQGSLKAIGAVGDSITFSTVSDGQKWRGIIIENVSSSNDSTLISRCIFERGDATLDGSNSRGGALRLASFSKLRLEKSRFSNCRAGAGGAVYATGSHLSIRDCKFKECTSTGNGGAIYSDIPPTNGSGSIYLYNSDFVSCGSSGVGGCVNLSTGINTIDNSRFYGSWSYQGSAVSFWFSGGTITNCLMTGGSVYNGGAGVQVHNSNVVVANNVIRDNTWSGYWTTSGVGIICTSSTCVIKNNVIANNNSFFGGGGIRILNSQFKVLNNLIVNNGCSYGGAGIDLESWNTGCLIANNTICNNAGSTGGLLVRGYANIRNNIIWGNSSGEGQIYARTNGYEQSYDYNCIQGGISSIYIFNDGGIGWQASQYGSHNVTGNPAFINPSAGAGTGFSGISANWRLSSGSSCYNAGDPTTDVSLYPIDLAGNIRISEGTVDIGAYEFMSPIIPRTPQNLILAVGPSAVLSWDAVTQALDGSAITVDNYSIYTADSPSGPWSLFGYSVTNQSDITGLMAAQRLFFKVIANN